MADQRRAGVVGLGLIGGSVGLRLREEGWYVVGQDRDASHQREALERGAVDEIGSFADTEVVFVATSPDAIVGCVQNALDAGVPAVTDVGSVKGAIAAAIDDPRFVPGHPMAGSEQEGIEGSRANMFDGAVWVLAPSDDTDPDAYAVVRSVVSSFGSDVIDVDPASHDALVAMVSHVPHLTAVTLMDLADQESIEHAALLRLAAGGFRDMTRIAAGPPGIWPQICAQNATSITAVLDRLIAALGDIRHLVETKDEVSLVRRLETARAARLNLPTSVPRDQDLTEVRIPVLDQPGELALITRLATDIDCNIFDLEIRHSAEGQQGVIILLVASARSERLLGALMAHDYRPSLRKLG